MKRSLILMSCLFALITSIYAAKKTKVIKITVEPKEAAIYVNNTLAGYGDRKSVV